MTTVPYVEQDCTFTHEGRAFTSGGAVVTPDRAIGYLGERQPDGSRSMNDWHGNILGSARVVGSWRLPRNCWISDRMYQIEATINGVVYTGRGCGSGMIWRGRRKAD